MNTRKLLFFLFIVVFPLSACNSDSVAVSSPTITVSPTVPSTISSATPTPHPANTATPTSSLPVSSAPDGLRMAYVIDGNLYFQEGSNPSLQLTHSGEDWRPLFFSENGEKVFFFRGVILQDLYSINVDGSQERALVTNSMLATFGGDYDESTAPCGPVLVPHTHLLLFRTCSHPDEYTTIYQDDLFIADTDTNRVKTLLQRGQGGTYYVSPDGSMLAIDRLNSIDILGIDGKLIRRKLATYPRSEPIPVHSLVYWASDSSELIAALPINTFYDTSLPPTYKIWRYSLDNGVGVQFNLDPSPMSQEPMWVSPDGNWITYNNHDERSFYLGDLRDGRAQAYEIALPYAWSPDSVHFVYKASQPSGTGLGLYLASVNAPSVFIGKGEFLGWLDASRYVYFTDEAFVMGEIGGESMPILVGNTQHLYSYASIIFIYQPLSK